jgi:hypothetical protein
MPVVVKNVKAANQLRLPGGITIPKGGSAVVPDALLASKAVKTLLKHNKITIKTGLPGPVGLVVDTVVNQVLDSVVEDVVLPVAEKVIDEVVEAVSDAAEAVGDLVSDLFEGDEDKPKRRRAKKTDSQE